MNDLTVLNPLGILDSGERQKVLTQHPAHLIRRTYQIFLYCFDEAMAGLNLSPVMWIMIATARNYPGLSVTELARSAVVDKASCGRTATMLEKRGLLLIRKSDTDGRQKVLELTPAGVALAIKGEGRVERLRSLLLDQLDKDEKDRFVGQLASYVQKSGKFTRSSIPEFPGPDSD